MQNNLNQSGTAQMGHAGSVGSSDGISGHVYDGIREYDNPLPGWWKWLFIGTFAFSVLYWMFFHTGAPGRTRAEAYDRDVAENMKLRFSEIGTLALDRSTLLKYMKDPKWVAFGKVVFKTHCVSCHGANAGGVSGPNLCDDYWKNVKKVEDIIKVIAEGAANGNMPAWRNRLHQNEVLLLSAYIASLRGSAPPPGAKPQEGNHIADPWE